ncbi:unnamed protein product [Tetraodon nigroviridis]|uniref:(spotted green pufferfish) hypothetical protein n=1 Tax=Tetraodon nigroviridis TaxID=99883 RepID=Q4SHD8_TETNG|nr:unnamed protein product [Tetraodon nigroviridis]
MTHLVLPQMVERKRGAILNISSASGMYPVPLLTVYSASKAFVDFFSRGLQAEYKSRGVVIQSVLPFFVATKMSKIRRPTLTVPSPESYVSAALSTVGLQTQTNGYLPHAIMGWVTTALLPAKILTGHVMRMNLSMRAYNLKRQKDKQKAGRREPRLRCLQCGIIEEEEEDCSSLEEDQAQRSFLQTLESLRRSTR